MAKPFDNIDKNSFEPAYIQIANIIRRQITDGNYFPGDRLPTESELRKKYNVSPMTIRRSINLLLDQKIVKTVQGSGTFVRPIELDTLAFRLEALNKIFRDSEQTNVRLLEIKIERADELTAQKLDIQLGDRTILLRRLILADDDPILYHKEHLVYDPFMPIVETEMEVTSLHGLFRKTGESNLKWGELAIDVTVLSKDVAHLLKVPENLPAFRLEHVFYDFNDTKISWGRFFCRGDRFRFTTQIGFSGK